MNEIIIRPDVHGAVNSSSVFVTVGGIGAVYPLKPDYSEDDLLDAITKCLNKIKISAIKIYSDTNGSAVFVEYGKFWSMEELGQPYSQDGLVHAITQCLDKIEKHGG